MLRVAGAQRFWARRAATGIDADTRRSLGRARSTIIAAVAAAVPSPIRIPARGFASAAAAPPSEPSALSKRVSGDFSDKRPFPERARVVIIGGGVVGCSVAYHLAKLGWGHDIVLLESGSLSCGTTWHAAGLIGQMRGTASETQLSGVYGTKLYAELEAETGVATGFRRVGSLTLARSLDRLTLLKRNACSVEASMAPQNHQR